ncbi:chemotaxis protein CheW [Chryseolinea lacunae]|uniref:Purine-binding chemotaxis protein CheW n=1 Tax=Chryseolinea lacunae TaxID=2801331 RepID=A0ABS1KNS9_9BACT|nr:chemotaxis protein CheW [Chryseolinea lacunae]MBL0741104.1 purine-binding chemotaxis protein CheW [Chryseolinea lacunae]
MSDVKTSEAPAKAQRTLQIVVFKLGQEEYGLQIDQIKEVVITPTITRMPQTPPYIKGVANIRGNVIAIFDLEERFNLTRTQKEGNKYTLVVESEDVKLGLLVSEVPNTISVNPSDLDESVSIINDASTESNYIKGIIKSRDRLIILIDIFKVIDYEMSESIKKTVGAS